jgi:hypothetical protein
VIEAGQLAVFIRRSLEFVGEWRIGARARMTRPTVRGTVRMGRSVNISGANWPSGGSSDQPFRVHFGLQTSVCLPLFLIYSVFNTRFLPLNR